MSKEDFIINLIGLLLFVSIVGWIYFKADCGFFKYFPLTTSPLRCIIK